MAELKLYPVGIQTFEEIITRNLLYVDKTEYVYRMTHSGGKHFFLSRPRRFGKSLLVSTFKSYFQGKKELFKGLAIEKLENEWTEYPKRFALSGLPIVKVGVNFDVATHNITDWKIEYE